MLKLSIVKGKSYIQIRRILMSHFHQNWERGQGLVEYALILLFVALAVFVTLGLLGGQLNVPFEAVREALEF